MMGLGSLALFITGMWGMILAVCAFLVMAIAPIEAVFGENAGRLTISAVQAAIAIVAVIMLVIGLSRMKRVYMHRKLKQ
jgi:hypothetical protein